MDEDGQLNVVEFCVAMHLVQQVLRGVSLPSSLPESILACVEFAVNPRLPIADDKHLKKCRSAFGAFHANIGKGVLGGECSKSVTVLGFLREETNPSPWPSEYVHPRLGGWVHLLSKQVAIC